MRSCRSQGENLYFRKICRKETRMPLEKKLQKGTHRRKKRHDHVLGRREKRKVRLLLLRGVKYQIPGKNSGEKEEGKNYSPGLDGGWRFVDGEKKRWP